jgi:uncharacterized protein (DUF2141 family)
MKVISYIILIICILSYDLKAQLQDSGSIHITVTGLKNTKGQLGILLFNSAQGFPSDWQQAEQQLLLPISGAAVEYTITGLNYGEYAIAVLHDENMNNQMDTNFLGIPKEGNGASNNVKGSMGPPKFKDAAFQLTSEKYLAEIKMNY